MELLIGGLLFACGIAVTLLLVGGKQKNWLKKSFGGETKAAWMTRQQLVVLESIAKPGKAGIRLWFTDINLSTVRSLVKRGFVDTRSGGRIVATRSGKKRLSQPWPDRPSTSDHKETGGSGGSNVQAIAPGASDAASEPGSLT